MSGPAAEQADGGRHGQEKTFEHWLQLPSSCGSLGTLDFPCLQSTVLLVGLHMCFFLCLNHSSVLCLVISTNP